MNIRTRLASSPTLRRPVTTALRATQRLRHAGSATRPVVINSIPKAGTHLAAALIETADIAHYSGRTLIGAALTSDARGVGVGLSAVRPGFYAPAHIPFTIEIAQQIRESGAASLCVVRDPRAIAASHATFVMQRANHDLHQLYAGLAPRERLRATIVGTRHGGFELPPLSDRLEMFEGWLRDPTTLMVRFEDLAGVLGGGSDDVQRSVMKAVSDHCGVPRDLLDAGALSRAFGRRSSTFSTGRTDGWRSAYDQDLLKLFDTHVGEVSRRLGYP